MVQLHSIESNTMFRVRLPQLQEYLCAIEEQDTEGVIYSNFQTQMEFGPYLSSIYSIMHVTGDKRTASQNLNFYLSVKGAKLSCILWISKELKDKLVDNYYVNYKLFIPETSHTLEVLEAEPALDTSEISDS